jgi:type I restriction enzyme S subunit
MPDLKAKPEVRFVGFADAWEQRALGEVADIVGGGTPSTGIADYWGGDIDWYAPAEIGKQIFVSGSQKKITELGFQNSSAKILPVGAILFTSRAGIGNTAIMAKSGTTNQGFQAIVPHKNEADSYFIFSRTHELKRYGETVGAGSTFVEVSGKQMAQMPIMMPIMGEQKQIGAFFSTLDRLLTLHQRELIKLQNMKKTLLEKMFPKNGADRPEVRFAGFADTWEQRALGEVTTSYSGGTPSVGKSEYYDGNIPFIRSAEINSDTTELFLSESGLNNSSAKMVYVGDILYALYGATSGEVGIAQLSGAINQAILAIKPNDGYESLFIMQWLRSQKQKIIDKYLQGGQGNLSGALVKDLRVLFPFQEEQRQIGMFFTTLDHLLTLHRHELIKLQNMKKALLEKMFV